MVNLDFVWREVFLTAENAEVEPQRSQSTFGLVDERQAFLIVNG